MNLDSYVYSVGISYRDYDTLFAAARKSDREFVVVTKDFALRKLQIPPNVTIHTNLFDEQASRLMQNAAVVVIPLIYKNCPAGETTLFEAMSYSKPTIVTRTIITEEYIEDGRDGILVPWKNPEAIVAALEYIYCNPEKAKRIGKMARKSVVEKYSMQVFARNVVSILNLNYEK